MTDRPRPGRFFMPEGPQHTLEQERSLELPLGYDPDLVFPRVAVLLHAYHLHLLPEVHAYLRHIPGHADLFISTDTDAKRDTILSRFATWDIGTIEVCVMPNRGRDIAPKLVGFADVHDRYEYVLHLHTKSSPHDDRLAGWRGYLLETLLGSPATVRGVFEAFARRPSLGIIAPQHVDELRPWITWGVNHPLAEGLAARMGFALPDTAALDFPSGSMFWARSAALRPLLDLHLDVGEFPAEAAQIDGTLAHAIERLYFLVCERAGFEWLKIAAQGELHDQRGVTTVSSPQHLDRFLARQARPLLNRDRAAGPSGIHPVVITPPPRPKRVLRVTWREALGHTSLRPGLRPGLHLVVALHGPQPSAARSHSADLAMRHLPDAARGTVLTRPGATRAAALEAGFALGADVVLAIDGAGQLHPASGAALLRMAEAHDGRVLMQLAAVGDKASPPSTDDLGLHVATGPAIAVPRAVYEMLGGYDDTLDADDADRDYSDRARAAGIPIRLCPAALFQAAASPDTRHAA